MNQQETQFRALFDQFVAWQQSQQGQTDGFAFEESFQTFTQDLNHQLMAMALQTDTSENEPAKKK